MAALSKLGSVATPRNTALAASAFALGWIAIRQKSQKEKKRKTEQVKYVIGDSKGKRDKAAVDGLFFRRIWRILKILVPGWFTSEVWYLLVVAMALVARTGCDVWMIENGTSIESAIIGRSSTLFKKHLFRLLYAMPAISLVNNILKYGLNELKLRFRTRLSMHLYEQYLRTFTYYKMSNLDNRIANPDQLLTQDVDKLCTSVGELYSNLSKPLLDIAIYATRLTNAIGAQGPFWMLAYLVVSGLILTRLRRPIGRMTVTEQKLEGEFRYVNSRLITNCEEIAFYQGNRKEKTIILASFEKLVNHLRNFIFFRFSMGLVDNVIAKYCSFMVGYFVVSRPFFDMGDVRMNAMTQSDRMEVNTTTKHPMDFMSFMHLATVCGFTVVSRPFLDLTSTRFDHMSQSEKMEDYYQSGRMLVKMAEAIGRVVLAGREMTRLAGFTARVTEFMKVLEDLNRGRYERTMVTVDKNKDTAENEMQLTPGSGKLIIQDKLIRFEKVPLVTPNGDILVNELNFEVKSGMNVLVCGPNGCGKSSLFRILGELWPLFGGTLTKPDSKHLFYIPQRPYMTLGTLRDQVIYPDNKAEQLKKGYTDRDLEDILTKVQLGYILDREGGWDAVQDWMDVLSGGEKQRVAMARLFYHKPQFAILDECTSAVSVDVEGFMYQHCREVGITLFTVSHRKSLWKHHEYYLHMDGRGSFEFKPIDSSTVEFGS